MHNNHFLLLGHSNAQSFLVIGSTTMEARYHDRQLYDNRQVAAPSKKNQISNVNSDGNNLM